MRRTQVVILSAATLAVALGYYGLADSLDLVPGPLTASAEDIAVQPFPTLAASALAAPTADGLSTSAPVPSSSELASLASTLEADPLLGGATAGVSIIDVATGDVLLDHKAGSALTPASSIKLLTAWAALSALGPEHTLTTSTVLDGSTLTLVAGGDVLLAEDKGDASRTAGHAGLGDLARATAEKLKEQGVTSVSVALDDTLFSGPTWNSAWEDGNQSWVAPVQPIMIDVSAYAEGSGYPSDPAMEAADAFVAHLKEAGITVTGTTTRAAASDSATEIASVESAPLADILAVSLKVSDNTMTEVEGHVLAAAVGEDASFEGAARAVLAQLKKDGFSTDGVTLLDSSGLALGDKAPASLLAQIVARAAGSDGGAVGRTLLADLPVGALDGTLDDRYIGTSAAGTVRAKTGSLATTASLTGTLVTKDGRLLAFSVITDGFADGGLASARAAIDQDLIVPLTQ